MACNAAGFCKSGVYLLYVCCHSASEMFVAGGCKPRLEAGELIAHQQGRLGSAYAQDLRFWVLQGDPAYPQHMFCNSLIDMLALKSWKQFHHLSLYRGCIVLIWLVAKFCCTTLYHCMHMPGICLCSGFWVHDCLLWCSNFGEFQLLQSADMSVSASTNSRHKRYASWQVWRVQCDHIIMVASKLHKQDTASITVVDAETCHVV